MKERLYRLKRNIQKMINSFLFKYGNNRYAIAFRQRNGKALYENGSSPDGFILVKNTFRYWMADPFLIKHNGVNYLFAELYDKKHSKGVIGYAKLKGNRCGRFHICLREKYHLSYPCVFHRDGIIYMIPETADNKEAALYEALDFPKKWKKVRTVCGQACVDTTPFCYQNENYYFTTIVNEHSSDDNLFLINEKSGECKLLLKDSLCLRSAGNVIFEKDGMIRPSQDDTVYGDAVIFNRIVGFSVNGYEEIPYKRVLPPDGETDSEKVCVGLLNNRKRIQFNGLHTYNVNDDYEVIDLRYPRLKKESRIFMPEISVVVPVYKVSEYLKRCVNSILAQTYTSFDLILIDDGSPDDCGEICDRYQKADSRVHVIHQENQGLAEARNVGIEWALKNSDSEWITFIDSDDWIHKDYLKLLYETAISHNVELSICNCIKTPELCIDEPEPSGNIKIFTPEDFWYFRQYGGAWAKLYKKSHFENIRYPKGLLYEDIFVTYRLIFMQSEVAYIESPLYFYFLRDDSITKSQWNPRVLAQFDGMKQQLDFFRKNNYKRAYEVTARNYLLHIRNNIESCDTVKNKYPKEYRKLKRMYKSSLIRFSRLLPIKDYINLYRYGFPWFVKLYKKFAHLKELVRFGK